jgi:hypothetical protein
MAENTRWNGTLVDGKSYILQNGDTVVMHSHPNSKLLYSFWTMMYEGNPNLSSYKESFRENGLAYHDDCGINVVGEA